LSGTALSLVTAITLFSATTPANAYPPYAKKENKSCAYCHVNKAGGGARNYRGAYYKAHGLTFASFDDAAEAKKAGVEIGPEPKPNPTSYTPPAKADADKSKMGKAKPGKAKKPAKHPKKTKKTGK
jgi:hypothetical protein